MALDSATLTSATTRRAVLAGTLGALGAYLAQALGRPLAARATDGDIIHVGDDLTAATTTKISNSINAGTALWGSCDLGWGVRGSSTSNTGVGGDSASGTGVYGYSNGAGYGVVGYSNSSVGVWGQSISSAVPAIRGDSMGSSTGVFGYSREGEEGTVGAVAKTGVYGYAAQDANARGVMGRSTVGQGVRGQATTGTGGYFTATTGTALQVTGKAKFSRSGKITVAAGASSVVKTFPGVTTSSMILALLQSNEAGVWVRAAVPAAGSFTVHFNVALPSSASVAYFILS
jgi:hypothetical protein